MKINNGVLDVGKIELVDGSESGPMGLLTKAGRTCLSE